MDLAKTYEPAAVEERWYRRVARSRLLPRRREACREDLLDRHPAAQRHRSLHMGHALTTRSRTSSSATTACAATSRSGFRAPITRASPRRTSSSASSRAKASSARDLGREKFSSASGSGRRESGGTSHASYARSASRCDWTRERFTMDEGLSRAVREVFVRLYEEGLIYRGRLHHQLVPALPDGAQPTSRSSTTRRRAASGTSATRMPTARATIVVATTRPETMLGDTAVAVHPDDERYRTWSARGDACRCSNATFRSSPMTSSIRSSAPAR